MSKYESFWKTTISQSSFRSAVARAANGATAHVAVDRIRQCSPEKKSWYGIVRVRHGGIVRVSRGDLAAPLASLGKVLANDGMLADWPTVVFRFTIDKVGDWLTVAEEGATKAPGVFMPTTVGAEPEARDRDGLSLPPLKARVGRESRADAEITPPIDGEVFDERRTDAWREMWRLVEAHRHIPWFSAQMNKMREPLIDVALGLHRTPEQRYGVVANFLNQLAESNPGLHSSLWALGMREEGAEGEHLRTLGTLRNQEAHGSGKQNEEQRCTYSQLSTRSGGRWACATTTTRAARPRPRGTGASSAASTWRSARRSASGTRAGFPVAEHARRVDCELLIEYTELTLP